MGEWEKLWTGVAGPKPDLPSDGFHDSGRNPIRLQIAVVMANETRNPIRRLMEETRN